MVLHWVDPKVELSEMTKADMMAAQWGSQMAVTWADLKAEMTEDSTGQYLAELMDDNLAVLLAASMVFQKAVLWDTRLADLLVA